jgi:hypothetical protein
MRIAEIQHGVAQCGRQDGGVSPALPALHAAFSSTATFLTMIIMMAGWHLMPSTTKRVLAKWCTLVLQPVPHLWQAV